MAKMINKITHRKANKVTKTFRFREDTIEMLSKISSELNLTRTKVLEDLVEYYYFYLKKNKARFL